jgi:hypothetical protein
LADDQNSPLNKIQGQSQKDGSKCIEVNDQRLIGQVILIGATRLNQPLETTEDPTSTPSVLPDKDKRFKIKKKKKKNEKKKKRKKENESVMLFLFRTVEKGKMSADFVWNAENHRRSLPVVHIYNLPGFAELFISLNWR